VYISVLLVHIIIERTEAGMWSPYFHTIVFICNKNFNTNNLTTAVVHLLDLKHCAWCITVKAMVYG